MQVPIAYVAPQVVLEKFITLCNERANFDDYLASNALLEDCNRSIRGVSRINTYLRYEISTRYEHDFKKANHCLPFEMKTSHLVTRGDPPENTILLNNAHFQYARLRQSMQSTSMQTPPPNTQKVIVAPPPVLRGKTFWESDDEMEITSGESGLHTPEKLPKKTESKVDTNSEDEDDEDDDNDNEVDEPLYKKWKSNNSEIKASPDSPDNSPPRPQLTSGVYSGLKYLEACGVLRRKSKHASLSLNPTTTSVSTPTSSSSTHSPERESHLDRKLKLKLSYRVCHRTHEIQFALIIYERLDPHLKSARNLELEFDNKTTESSKSTSPSPLCLNKKTTNSVKSPFKSLRF